MMGSTEKLSNTNSEEPDQSVLVTSPAAPRFVPVGLACQAARNILMHIYRLIQFDCGGILWGDSLLLVILT